MILKKRLTMRPQVVPLAIDIPHNSYSGCERIKDDVKHRSALSLVITLSVTVKSVAPLSNTRCKEDAR